MKGCDHKFIDSRHCLKCGWAPGPEKVTGDIGVRVYYDAGEYEVWVGPANDLKFDNIVNAFCAGIGASRDAAVADAVRELEALVAVLQARPDEKFAVARTDGT